MSSKSFSRATKTCQFRMLFLPRRRLQTFWTRLRDRNHLVVWLTGQQRKVWSTKARPTGWHVCVIRCRLKTLPWRTSTSTISRKRVPNHNWSTCFKRWWNWLSTNLIKLVFLCHLRRIWLPLWSKISRKETSSQRSTMPFLWLNLIRYLKSKNIIETLLTNFDLG